MPNLVFCNLYVSNDDYSELRILSALASGGKSCFTFEAIAPSPKTKRTCPHKYLRTDKSVGSPMPRKKWFDWYKWRIDHWGVRTDADNVTVTHNGPDEMCISFETQHEPPVQLLKELCMQCYPFDFCASYECCEGFYDAHSDGEHFTED